MPLPPRLHPGAAQRPGASRPKPAAHPKAESATWFSSRGIQRYRTPPTMRLTSVVAWRFNCPSAGLLTPHSPVICLITSAPFALYLERPTSPGRQALFQSADDRQIFRPVIRVVAGRGPLRRASLLRLIGVDQ